MTELGRQPGAARPLVARRPDDEGCPPGPGWDARLLDVGHGAEGVCDCPELLEQAFDVSRHGSNSARTSALARLATLSRPAPGRRSGAPPHRRWPPGRARGRSGQSRHRESTSGMPETGVETTGKSLAIASRITFGMPSRSPSSVDDAGQDEHARSPIPLHDLRKRQRTRQHDADPPGQADRSCASSSSRCGPSPDDLASEVRSAVAQRAAGLHEIAAVPCAPRAGRPRR